MFKFPILIIISWGFFVYVCVEFNELKQQQSKEQNSVTFETVLILHPDLFTNKNTLQKYQTKILRLEYWQMHFV